MMASITGYLEYFHIPSVFGPPGGVRWSAEGDVLECESDDSTFFYTRAVADFLEGFSDLGDPPHFGYVLTCLELLCLNPPIDCTPVERVRFMSLTYRKLQTPARNAGRMFAKLNNNWTTANAPRGGARSLSHWLTHSPSLPLLYPKGGTNTDRPAVGRSEMLRVLADKLQRMSEFEIRHWLRNGIGPSDDGSAPAAAEAVKRRPPSIDEFLDLAIRDRPRLARSRTVANQLLQSLTLPPHKRTPERLPAGGYADVVNRGSPDRLLPSQFALDRDDFVRRFAENELLYFRKEDPVDPRNEELVLVLDQSVGTWGRTRIALAGAVDALVRQAGKRHQSILVRCSSAPLSVFCVPESDPAQFGDCLEAGDLAPSSATAMTEESTQVRKNPVDVVLLTHPDTLTDGAMLHLADEVARSARCFILTADDQGEIQLHQARSGGTSLLHRCRVRFDAPRTIDQERPATAHGWTGPVDRLGFPLPIPLDSRMARICFDHTGEFIAVLQQSGLVHLIDTADGSRRTVPLFSPSDATASADSASRATEYIAIAPGTRGFAMVGTDGRSLWAVWIHAVTRKLKIAAIDSAYDRGEKYQIHPRSTGDAFVVCGDRFAWVITFDPGEDQPPFFTRIATPVAPEEIVADPVVELIGRDRRPQNNRRFVQVNRETGDLTVVADGRRLTIQPLSDGQSIYRTEAIGSALLREEIMALHSPAVARRPDGRWRLFDLNQAGKLLFELPTDSAGSPPSALYAAPNRDPLFVHFQQKSRRLTLHRLQLGPTPGAEWAVFPSNTGYGVRLGRGVVIISNGPKMLALDWRAGPLRQLVDAELVAVRKSVDTSKLMRRAAAKNERLTKTIQVFDLEASIDRFGMLVFRTRDQDVAALVTADTKWAIGTADGVYAGSPDLLGGITETAGARETLAHRLRSVQFNQGTE